jgi:hypothetical protein
MHLLQCTFSSASIQISQCLRIQKCRHTLSHKPTSPRWTIAGRHEDLKSSQVPGPGAYSPRSEAARSPSAPRWSMLARRDGKHPNGASPGQYRIFQSCMSTHTYQKNNKGTERSKGSVLASSSCGCLCPLPLVCVSNGLYVTRPHCLVRPFP